MKTNLPFDEHVAEYEEWYDRHPWIFASEVEAFRAMLPEGDTLQGMEVGLGTGRFSQALGIKEGVEPVSNMRKLAIERGIEVVEGVSEGWPYAALRFDFVLMAFCISYFEELHSPFKEAYRVLKNGGALVLGFLDKNSVIGEVYERRKPDSTFYRQANFHTVDKVLFELKRVGFKHVTLCQTLFGGLNDIDELQLPKPGYGEGSFVVMKAQKRKMV